MWVKRLGDSGNGSIRMTLFLVQNPEIPLFCSVRRVLLIYFWYYIGLLPYLPLKETHFEVVLPEISK